MNKLKEYDISKEIRKKYLFNLSWKKPNDWKHYCFQKI